MLLSELLIEKSPYSWCCFGSLTTCYFLCTDRPQNLSPRQSCQELGWAEWPHSSLCTKSFSNWCFSRLPNSRNFKNYKILRWKRRVYLTLITKIINKMGGVSLLFLLFFNWVVETKPLSTLWGLQVSKSKNLFDFLASKGLWGNSRDHSEGWRGSTKACSAALSPLPSSCPCYRHTELESEGQVSSTQAQEEAIMLCSLCLGKAFSFLHDGPLGTGT